MLSFPKVNIEQWLIELCIVEEGSRLCLFFCSVAFCIIAKTIHCCVVSPQVKLNRFCDFYLFMFTVRLSDSQILKSLLCGLDCFHCMPGIISCSSKSFSMSILFFFYGNRNKHKIHKSVQFISADWQYIFAVWLF